MARLKREISKPLNFEMAATDDMVAIALDTRPHACCLVPEKRSERTTEGGLDVVSGHDHLKNITAELLKAGVRVSLFIEPSLEAVRASRSIGAPVIELHTGAWCDALSHFQGERAARGIRPHQDGGGAGKQPGTRMSRGPWTRLCHGESCFEPAANRRTQYRSFFDRRGGLCRS